MENRLFLKETQNQESDSRVGKVFYRLSEDPSDWLLIAISNSKVTNNKSLQNNIKKSISNEFGVQLRVSIPVGIGFPIQYRYE